MDASELKRQKKQIELILSALKKQKGKLLENKDLKSPTPLYKEVFKDSNLTDTKIPEVSKIFDQRQNQREKLFSFAIELARDSLFFLIAITFLSMLTKIILGIELLSNSEFQVLSVAVFGQIISVVIIIAKSIWDDKPYKDILKDDHEKNKDINKVWKSILGTEKPDL